MKKLFLFLILAFSGWGGAWGQRAAPAEGSLSVAEALQKGKAANKNNDVPNAAKWYRMAAEKGDPQGEYELGMILLNNGQAMKLDAEFKKAKGDKKAKPDPKAASQINEGFDWLDKSAQQDYEVAEEMLGMIDDTGSYGLPHDPGKTQVWYEKAAAHYRDGAKQGKAEAQFKLGEIAVDETLSQYSAADYKKTKVDAATEEKTQGGWNLVRKSAEQGYAPAESYLADSYKDGTINGIPKDEKTSFIWYQKAADHGDGWAMYMVGWSLENGMGTSVDKKGALRWYQKAADKGNSNAKDALKRLK